MLGSPPNWNMPGNLQRKVPRRHLYQIQNHINYILSMQRSSNSTPSYLQMSEHLTLAQLACGGNSFLLLVSAILFLSHYAQIITTCEGWNIDRLVNWKLCLPAQLPFSPQWSGTMAALLLLILHQSATYKILVLSHSRNPNHFTFGCKPPHCVLKVAVWWSQQNPSSALSRDALLKFPIRTLYSPQLCLEILSMNITNTMKDSGQPWWSPTPTENMFDFVLRIQT